MKKKKWLALAMAALLLALPLAGCADGGDKVTLRIYNWGDYIDPDVLADFKAQNPDINVIYDTFDSNEAMLAKLDGGSNYDILFPSDYMVEKMIAEDKLQKLDLSKIENLSNIDARFMDQAYDPGNAYSIPYTWGTLGILYNTTLVDDPVDSWEILFDEKYAKQIIMYDSVRDSMAVALKYLGYSCNERDEAKLGEAGELLTQQKQSGLVKAYMTDQVKQTMISGSAALAVVYSGDAVLCMEENEDLAYAVPREGSNLFYDAVVMSKSCTNTEAAYRFINYLCDAEVAAKNITYIGYSTPNKAALELMDEQYQSDPVYNPDDAILQKCEVYLDLGEYTDTYNQIWEKVKLG
ncbi:MAG: ABC transporter substrate-binding protein [Christensenellales bacterium]|jgi:spermidine/putrescine transport system substrate-binding protein